tara:strand:- start:89 stop:382 length:294 start_codon:yes stop_codon:yes gene_type:complete
MITMVNDLGVDPNDWFDDYGRPPNPLDTMPLATDKSGDMPVHYLEVPTSVTNPKPKPKVEKTPHHIAYEIATAKYNPFAVGGSESISSLGGSENVNR